MAKYLRFLIFLIPGLFSACHYTLSAPALDSLDMYGALASTYIWALILGFYVLCAMLIRRPKRDNKL